MPYRKRCPRQRAATGWAGQPLGTCENVLVRIRGGGDEVMLPPEIGCPRCGFLFKTSAVFCALPALTRCPVCGLTVDELRCSLETTGPQARLESDLLRLEQAPSQRPSALLEAHLGGAKSGDLQKPLGRGPLDRPPRKRAA